MCYQEYITHQNSLLYECITVFPHVFQHLVCSCVSRGTAGLGRDCEWVDERLRVLLPNVNEQLVDETTHQVALCVYTGYQLWYHLTKTQTILVKYVLNTKVHIYLQEVQKSKHRSC